MKRSATSITLSVIDVKRLKGSNASLLLTSSFLFFAIYSSFEVCALNLRIYMPLNTCKRVKLFTTALLKSALRVRRVSHLHEANRVRDNGLNTYHGDK